MKPRDRRKANKAARRKRRDIMRHRHEYTRSNFVNPDWSGLKDWSKEPGSILEDINRMIERDLGALLKAAIEHADSVRP